MSAPSQGSRAGSTQASPGREPVPLIIPAVLVLTSCASLLSTDLYAPSLPHLPAFFATDAETVQLTMSFNLIGFTFGQLLLGPLSDRFGRRPVLLLAMVAFFFTSLACGLAETIHWLIAARAFQGIAACAEAVVILAIIRDLYDDDSGVKVLAAYGMAIALAPAVGPLIGGYVHVWLGWRANFFLLSGLLILVITLLLRFLPETTVPDRQALRFSVLAREYGDLLRRPTYLAYAAIAGCVLGGIFAFITAGPFLLIDRWGVATEHYGYFQAVIVAAYFVGSLAANRWSEGLGLERLLRLGLSLTAVGSLALPIFLLSGLESPVTITASVSICVLGAGFIFATAPMRALGSAAGSGGVAAALLGVIEMGGGSLGALAVGLFHDGSAWPLAVSLVAFTLLMLANYAVARIAPPPRPRVIES